MDDLAEQTKELLEEKLDLEPTPLPPEISHIKFPLRLLNLHCYNWRAKKVRKIYFMRIKVTIPSLDIFGMALYPETNLDIPSFVFDFSCTKKKVFSYINFVPLFNDPSYLEKYVEPMKEVHDKHPAFSRQPIREWMQPYVSPYAVYSLPFKTELPGLKRCALDYLKLYLKLFAHAEEIKDPAYLVTIEKARESYLKDLATYDNSRKMLGKIIGKERANRIFHEAIT
jgi:15,16-dihydrobiliverdin:ferredoxin oxidoreductase